MSKNSNDNDKRPLSPHLTIYRPQNTSILSILHRLTGIGLMFTSLGLALWILAIPLGSKYFEFVMYLFGTFLGKLFLIFSLWGIIYHSMTGIRHLIWDTGRGIDLKWVNLSSWFIALGSILLTGVIIFLVNG